MNQFNGFNKSSELAKVEEITSSIELLKVSEQLLTKSIESLKLLEDESLEQTIANLETNLSNVSLRITSISNLKAIMINAINRVERDRLDLIAQSNNLVTE